MSMYMGEHSIRENVHARPHNANELPRFFMTKPNGLVETRQIPQTFTQAPNRTTVNLTMDFDYDD